MKTLTLLFALCCGLFAEEALVITKIGPYADRPGTCHVNRDVFVCNGTGCAQPLYFCGTDGASWVTMTDISAAVSPAGRNGDVPMKSGTAFTASPINCPGSTCSIGTKFSVDGTLGRELLLGVSPPSAPAVVLSGTSGNVTNGTHVFLLTYITASGESAPGAISDVVTVADNTVNGRVALTIPTSADTTVTGRRVYQTQAGTVAPATATDYRAFRLVATISNNTATTYTANTADGSLGSQRPPFDATAGAVYWGNVQVGKWDSMGLYSNNWVLSGSNGEGFIDNTTSGGNPHRQRVLSFCCGGSGNGRNLFVGPGAGSTLSTITTANSNIALSYGAGSLSSLTSGVRNFSLGGGMTGVTTGSKNISINAIGADLTTGVGNIGIGEASLLAVAGAASFNTVYGYEGLEALTTGNNNVSVGYRAGNANVVTGSYNILIGSDSDFGSNSQHDNSVAIGRGATTDAGDSVSIGHGVANAIANTVNIGTNSKVFDHIGSAQLFSALPTCDSSYEGSRRPVSDSSTATWGATVAGSGANHVLAYCNGTNWTVAAK